MATKEEALQYIKSLGAQEALTRSELLLAYDEGSGISIQSEEKESKVGIAEILYYIGGGIVVLGISIFLGQNWESLNFFTKVLATLGSSVVAYMVGVFFSRSEQTERVGIAFHLIAALVMPIGLYVVFDNAGFDVGTTGFQSFMSAILFAVYLLSYVVFRKNVFALFSTIFGTWFYFAFTSYITNNGEYSYDWKFDEYRVLVIGLAYLVLGYAFSKSERAPLSGPLYAFGVIGFLGSAMSLGGWSPDQSVFWELVFPLLVFGVLFASVKVRSKAFLTFGTLFLMGYILKITSEYFSTGLGWPLALVLAGLLMIGAGYMSVNLNRRISQ